MKCVRIFGELVVWDLGDGQRLVGGFIGNKAAPAWILIVRRLVFCYGLDFPYEVENRYQKLKKEDQFIAELIWDDLVEDGAYLYNDLNETDFKERITKHYQYIQDVLI